MALIYLIMLIAYDTFVIVLIAFSICAGLFIKFTNKKEAKRRSEIAFGLLAGTISTVSIISTWLIYILIHRCG